MSATLPEEKPFQAPAVTVLPLFEVTATKVTGNPVPS